MKDSYDVIDEFAQDYQKSKDYWEIAKGLQKVDNLETSEYLETLISENLSGQKTYKQIDDEAKSYYTNVDVFKYKEKEADLSSIRIAMLLDSSDFRLLKSELLRMHGFIFENAFPSELQKYVGRFRDVNISKSEDILNGKSVRYTDHSLIDEYLDYDLDNERNRTLYENIDNIEHLARFISNIWNIHPFREGNTRTIAAFTLKYLKQYGFDVDNELFKNNSKYFRDSLVVASDNELFNNSDYSYLESFLTKLLVDKNHELKSMDEIRSLYKNKDIANDIDDMLKNKYQYSKNINNKNYDK